MLGYQRVASYPTPHDARAHFDEWIAFYQDFFNFPENLPVTFQYGFDSYKVTYCTNDAVLPGQTFAETTAVTGMVSVPRTSRPSPDGGLRARHVDVVLRRPVESEHVRRLQPAR